MLTTTFFSNFNSINNFDNELWKKERKQASLHLVYFQILFLDPMYNFTGLNKMYNTDRLNKIIKKTLKKEYNHLDEQWN